MRHLIVARFEEPLTWLGWLATASKPWTVTVVSNGVHRPNSGREAGAYLWWIVANYERLHPYDVYAFVQADPFPHCADIYDRLHDEPGGFKPMGDRRFETDAYGAPHHAGLPVGDWYHEIIGEPMPQLIYAYAGGQFLARGSVLMARPKSFWQQLLDRASTEPPAAWVLERLWAPIFGREV